ncbi:hypothetical protein NDU88_002979 [Pleurodeles waltl]|uniref:Uncharacterized protein n=1 Tax=Pleurodeles waltl TaxID=8319 RepID=A0AAV7NNF8_PLEWA|nr:hypothetical protein NDU88_002979 [Pleurodeles waltl]
MPEVGRGANWARRPGWIGQARSWAQQPRREERAPPPVVGRRGGGAHEDWKAREAMVRMSTDWADRGV